MFSLFLLGFGLLAVLNLLVSKSSKSRKDVVQLPLALVVQPFLV